MTVAAILKHKGSHVITVAPSATVSVIAATLTQHRIGAAPVVDADDRLVGIVSERDVVACLAANGAAALAITAERIMTSAPQVATLATTVAEAMAAMTAGRFRHLPVVAGGRMIGLVSIGDVVKARIMAQETEVDSLKAYVAGAA
jgi:CBS domain-containing protein